MSTFEHLLYPVVAKDRRANPDRRLFGKLRNLAVKIFVCWHRKQSRPFTHDGESYRVCLRCGMHRRFDLGEWKSKGSFYKPTLER